MKRIMHNLLITLLLTASPLGFAEGKTNLPNAFALRPPAESPPPQTPPPQTPDTTPPITEPPTSPEPPADAPSTPFVMPTAPAPYIQPAPPKTPVLPKANTPPPTPQPQAIQPPTVQYIDLTSPENTPLHLPEKPERNFAKNGAWKKNLFQPNKSDFSLPQEANGRSYAEWNTTAASPQKNYLRALFSEQNDIKPILYEQEINKKPHKSWLPEAFSFKKSENKNLVVDPIYDKKSFLLENNEPETIATLQYIRRAEDLGLDYAESASRALTIYQKAYSEGKSLEEANREIRNTAHYVEPQFGKLFDRTKEGLNAIGGFIFDGTKVAFEVLVLDDIRAIYNAQGPIEFFGAVASMTPIGKIRKLGKLDDAVDKFEDLKDARKNLTPAEIATLQSPYSSHQWRNYFEGIWGRENILSTTTPPPSAKNVGLAGKRHPETNIVFDNKGFPIFDDIAIYDTRVNPLANPRKQMRDATKDLANAIKRGIVKESQFTPEELKSIYRGDEKILNHTWHHAQDSGRMQLVKEKLHRETGHIGNRAMREGK